MENLLGVVLCGGESKRMGSDKGLLPIEDTIWAKYVAAKIAPFTKHIVFSVNNNQLQDYSNYIAATDLVVDSVDVQGPLTGLLSVHQQYPQQDILLLACDMLDLDEITIDTIVKLYQQEKGFGFYVYQDIEFAQPFCGIYTSKGLSAILEKAASHSLMKFSLQQVLNTGNTKRLPVPDPKLFRNYNEPI